MRPLRAAASGAPAAGFGIAVAQLFAAATRPEAAPLVARLSWEHLVRNHAFGIDKARRLSSRCGGWPNTISSSSIR